MRVGPLGVVKGIKDEESRIVLMDHIRVAVNSCNIKLDSFQVYLKCGEHD